MKSERLRQDHPEAIFEDTPTVALFPELPSRTNLRPFTRKPTQTNTVIDPFVMPPLPGRAARLRKRSVSPPPKASDLPPKTTKPHLRVASAPPAILVSPPHDGPPPELAADSTPAPTSKAPVSPGAIAIATIFAVAAVACAFVLRPSETGAAKDSVRASAVSAPAHPAVDVAPMFKRADELVAARRFQNAEALLATLDPRPLDSAQQIRLNDLRSEAFLGHHLAMATLEFEGGHLEEAMDSTRRLLLHRPSHPAALALLTKIRAATEQVAAVQEAADRMAAAQAAAVEIATAPVAPKPVINAQRVTLRSTPPGLFLVNGTPVGYSPARGIKMLHGAHRIEIRREGFEMVSAVLKVDENTKIVRYELKPLASDTREQAAR